MTASTWRNLKLAQLNARGFTRGRARWLIPVVCVSAVVAVGWWSLRRVEQAKHRELAGALQTTLDANVTALQIWLDAQKAAATVLIQDPRVRDAVAQLNGLRGPAGEDAPRDALLASPAAGRLRDVLGPPSRELGFTGFFVFDRSGRVVGASEDAAVGGRAVAERTDAVARALAGKPTVSRPFLMDTPADGAVPAMLVAVPVRSAGGDVIGALAMRVRPESGFTRILQVARYGESGETYAVDARGLLLSQSRFDDQIRRLGLLADRPDSRSMLGMDIRDPGGDLTAGFRPATARGEQPLTKMAAAAAAGRDGMDVDGYPDYRGVPVIGAWKWLPEYGMGVATEVDVEEAYEPLDLLRNTILVLLGLLLVSNAAFLLAFRNIEELNLKARRAELKVRQLGQYTLEDKLGEGGMGAVYRASHALLRRPTAIKLLTSERPGMREMMRFEREVQLTSRLNHPNTITVFDYGRTPEGVFYYAMEYVAGLTLDRLVQEDGPQPEGRVVYVLAQIVAALKEAHAIGLIHRDIKPANVMLCERGGMYDFVKVLDFGLVREARSDDPSLTNVGAITGTPQYMPPEAIRDASAAEPRSDLYAVGAVGYFLLTGRPVFAGSSVTETLAQQLTALPEPPSHVAGRPVSPGLEALILSCLAKTPAGRPADAAAMLAALQTCRVAEPWTNDDARAWWQKRKAAGPAAVAPATAGTAEASTAVTVDHVKRPAEVVQ